MNHHNETAPSAAQPAATRDRSGESITDLIRSLATDTSSLLGKEIALAKSEVRESVSAVQTAVGAIAIGAALATAGLVVVLMGAVYGLSNVLDPWLAALIVGAAALVVGYVMIHSAKGRLSASSMVPERTIESAKKDVETLQRATR